MAGPIRISILANASQARREVSGLSGTFKKAMGAAGLAIGGAAVVGGIKSVVDAASKAQQSLGGTQAVFGKYADTVVKESDRAASAFGLSANDYRESANLIGSLLKNQGVAQDKLAGKTQKLVGLSSDLAATYGGTTKDAVEALSSAFKGEFDPLEKYGVSLKQSTVNAEALRVAHVKTTTEFNKLSTATQNASKRQATQNLLMKQSADAQGQFQKQTNTLAEQQQILGAKFDNLKVKLGQFLLPILTKVFGYLSDTALPAVQDLGGEMRDKLGPAVDVVKSAFQKAKPFAEKVINFIKDNPDTVETFAAVLVGLAGAVAAASAAFAVLNAVMSANPIGIIIVAIAALAAGFVYAYKHCEVFRKIVDFAFGAIKLYIETAWKVLEPIFKLWVLEIKAIGAIAKWLWSNVFAPVTRFIIGAFEKVIQVMISTLRAVGNLSVFGKKLFPWADTLADKLQGAADKANALANGIRSIPTTHDTFVRVHYSSDGVGHAPGGHIPVGPSARSMLGSISRPIDTRPNVQVTIVAPVGASPYDIGEQLDGYLREYQAATA